MIFYVEHIFMHICYLYIFFGEASVQFLPIFPLKKFYFENTLKNWSFTLAWVWSVGFCNSDIFAYKELTPSF